MENSNDIKSIDIEERLNPSLTNATVNIVTYTFRMKYGKKYFEKFLTTPIICLHLTNYEIIGIKL